MRKILYISGIDWNWIKQRPQIIGEGLSKYYDTYVVYPKSYRRHNLTKETTREHRYFHLMDRIKIPFSGTYRIMNYLDFFCQQQNTKKMIRRIKPDIIYISHPRDYFKEIEKFSGLVIYDYMDNYEQLANDYATKKIIKKYEEKVISRADIILCTSKYLKKQLSKKYIKETSKISIVRNGYLGGVLDIQNNKKIEKDSLDIAYVGTVGPWFDFNTLAQIVELRPNIVFHIFGPIAKEVSTPSNKNFVFEGVIEHSEIYNAIKECDALIMPFCVNEIVKAVDPVKLYEYINFNKPIISVYYDEIERFRPFVMFYNGLTDLIGIFDRFFTEDILAYSDKERLRFLEENNWNSRIKQITSIIDYNIQREKVKSYENEI